MKEDEVGRIAVFVESMVVDGEDPYRVKEDVMKFAEELQEIEYCLSSVTH